MTTAVSPAREEANGNIDRGLTGKGEARGELSVSYLGFFPHFKSPQ